MTDELSDVQKRANAQAYVDHVLALKKSLDHTASKLSAGGAFDRRDILIAIEAELRKELVRADKAANPELTTRELGEKYGVSHTQARRDLGTDVPGNGQAAEENQSSPGTDVPESGPPHKILARRRAFFSCAATAIRLVQTNHLEELDLTPEMYESAKQVVETWSKIMEKFKWHQ